MLRLWPVISGNTRPANRPRGNGPIGAIVAAIGILFGVTAQAQVCQGPIRSLPYPFGNALAFASDVDMQSPEYGAELHKMINGSFGLPIGDSVWVQGWTPGLTYFLNNVTGDLNALPTSTGDKLPTYFELLRQWYRGNIDHFHGWAADDLPRLAHVFDPPVDLASTSAAVTLHGVEKDYGFPMPPLLRVFADTVLPADTRISFTDSAGKSVTLDVGDARLFEGYGKPPAHVYEWNLHTAGSGGLPPYTAIAWRNLAGFTASAASCNEDCKVRLQRFELSGFGRSLVEQQSKWLKQMNVRPLVFTSHGGWTEEQNFYPSLNKSARKVAPTLPSMALLDMVNERRAGDQATSDYAVDLYRELGMAFVELPVDRDFNFNSLRMANLTLRSLFDLKAHEFSRTAPLATGPDEDNGPVAQLKSFLPDLTEAEIADISRTSCGPGCGVEADGVRSEILASLLSMQRHAGLEHLWYTHFGAPTSVEWTPHPKGPPYSPATQRVFGRLASGFYGWSSIMPKGRRVWVASATTLVNYASMRSQIAAHVTSDGPTIRIQRWTDIVTGRVMPSTVAPAADLNGITFYISGNADPQLLVDGAPIRSFIRNPADECGRASITVVDSSSPTSLFAGLDLDAIGVVKEIAGTASAKPADAFDNDLLLKADADGRLAVDVQDNATQLINSPYVMLEMDRARTTAPLSSLNLEIEILTDGGRLLLTTDRNRKPDATTAVLTLDRDVLASSGQITLPLYNAAWSAEAACGIAPEWKPCALPLGTVRHWTVRFKSSPRATLALRRLAFLRADPTVINNTDRTLVIGGQVRQDGKPAAGIDVAMRDTGGKTAGTQRTDEQGSYLFSGIPNGAELTLAVSRGGKACAAAQRPRFRAERNTLDRDIDLTADCALSTATK